MNLSIDIRWTDIMVILGGCYFIAYVIMTQEVELAKVQLERWKHENVKRSRR